MTRFSKTLRIAVAALALGTAGFAATSLSTASDAAAWDGPGNFKNGKGGGGGGGWGGPGGFKNPGKGGGGGGAWKGPKGGHHGHHGKHGWGKYGYGYGYGAAIALGAAIPVIVGAPDCYTVYAIKFVPGIGKVKEKVTVCD